MFSYDKEVIDILLEKKVKVLLFKDSNCFSEKLKEGKYNNEIFKEFYPPKIVDGLNGSFHPKLYLLKFKKFLRVVIGSANLFVSDWEDWNNILWVKDFPKKNNS